MKNVRHNVLIAILVAIVIGLGFAAADKRKQGKLAERAIILQNVIGVSGVCKDGKFTTAKKYAKGACSHHGGVQEWLLK